ncbi:peroxisomal enoyl-CoA-hydratase [Artomyces pyxidatus]|uniref:Peroxisomal enoyl-CoA-hydratase n=1 Tax=Artomyces pyxidatus TaxID=48021 RepID=A0ACB8TG02_9AGAM|nr:peroxisomal enoyl-CoA-hydratase [Artomyces pyxidatus]
MSYPDYGAQGYTSILVTLDGAVAVVTINRAKERNTFSGSFIPEIIAVFDLLDRDDRVRVVVFTAESTAPAYCSGADLTGGWSIITGGNLEGPQAYRDAGGQVSLAIFRCRKITIAAVNGHAVGVGITGLQLPFDFRFVWAGAKLAFPFVRRGISAEAASSWLLPRLLGHSKATALLLTGGTFNPDSPYLQGLYHQILPTREEVFPAAFAFAKDLAENTSQTSVAWTKALLWHPADSIEEQHIIDSRGNRELAGAADGAEGAKAFKEKRPVKFTDTLSENLSNYVPWWKEIDVRYRKAKL